MPLAYGLIETADIALPQLDPVLDGLRVGHVTDLHTRRPRRVHEKLVSQMAAVRLDLGILTGDYMTRPGDEPAAFDVIRRLIERVRPRLGWVGVFGNHDTPMLREQVAGLRATWLTDEARALDDEPIDLLGLNAAAGRGPDAVELAMSCAERLAPRAGENGARRFRIALSHYPTAICTASDLGVDLMFAGHTHGGQIRLPGGRALVNSCDLPARCSGGILRHRNTVMAVARGIGTMTIPLRLFCPPHVPVYTLRRGPLHGQFTDDLDVLETW